MFCNGLCGICERHFGVGAWSMVDGYKIGRLWLTTRNGFNIECFKDNESGCPWNYVIIRVYKVVMNVEFRVSPHCFFNNNNLEWKIK